MKTFKRSFVFLLALVMLCGVILSATVPASALDTPVKGKQCNDYRGWAQDDPRWYNVKLNKCKELTFWHAGCAIISYTKLLIQSGVKDTSFLPSDMNTWMRNNGGFTDSTNAYADWKDLANISQLVTYGGQVNLSGTTDDAYESKLIMDAIKAGYYIIVGVNNNGHWVVVDNATSLAKGYPVIWDTAKMCSNPASYNIGKKLFDRYDTCSKLVKYKVDNKKATLTYNPNGGTGTYSTPTVSYNANFTIPAAPTRAGYTFTGWHAYRHGDGTWYCAGYGWYTDAAISANGYSKKIYVPGTTYALNDSWFKGCTNNTAYTFYAQWAPNEYTVTYDADGGTGALAAVKAYYGNNVTVSSTVPTCAGFKFVGWCTDQDPNLGTMYAAGEELTVTGDVTLYAVWERQVATPKIAKLENKANGIQISWNAVAGAEKYKLVVKEEGGSWKTIWNTIKTSYTWTGAESGKTYTFGIRCTTADGKTYTSSFDATGKTITYVARPTIGKLENTATGIKISWNKVPGAAKYKLVVKESGGSWKTIWNTVNSSYTWTGAESGKTYTFGIRCTTADGKSYTSAFDSTGKTIKYVAQPAISGVSNGANGVKLTWKAVPGAANYRIVVKTASSGWKTIANTTGTSFTWTGATSGVTYTFGIRCTTADGTAYTSSFDAAGKTIKYVAMPKIAKLTSTADGISITWNKVAGAAMYRVYVKTDSGWKTIGATTGSGFLWTEAKKGVTYTFTVRCYNSANTTYTSYYDSTGWTVKYT